jgi:hypothetical protein
MAHSAVPQHQLERARKAFRGDALKGFDTAVALHMGRVLSPRPNVGSPAKSAGYFVMKGIQGAPPGRILAVAKTVTAAGPLAKAGASIALKELTRKTDGPKIVELRRPDSRSSGSPEPPAPNHIGH